LKHIATIATERYHLDSAVICRQGATGGMLYIIASGQVKVTRSGKELAVRQRPEVSLAVMRVLSNRLTEEAALLTG
jgi:hypothetical protein